MKARLTILILALCFLICACERREIPMDTTAAAAAPAETQPSETLVPDTSPPETEAPVQASQTEPAPEEFVRVLDFIPGMYQELRYATADNFTGQVIYDFTDAYLRYSTVKKLAAVNEDLAQLGLALKIWDGFRPVSAQYKLWEVCPDPTFVANPTKGFSSHSRGNTVDVTLVDLGGTELEMPSAFDDFSDKANRDYSDTTETAAAHAQLLEILMEKHGFYGYFDEWWHFYDNDQYPVEDTFTPPSKN